VVLVEPASIHTEAVDKLARDAELLLRESDPCGRALYETTSGASCASASPASATAARPRWSPEPWPVP
jgi:hypothetical protein